MPEDEDRVFDVSKPHKVSPSANSRPVIVGHHPMMSDPMVTENRPEEPEHDGHKPTMTHVPVSFDGAESKDHKAAKPVPEDDTTKESFFMPAAPPEEAKTPAPDAQQAAEIYPHHEAPSPPPALVQPDPLQGAAPNAAPQGDGPLSDLPLPTHHGGKPSHGNGKPKAKKPWMRILLLVVILLAAYGLLDAKTTVSLPFYIFRKTTPAVQAPAVAPTATAPVSSVPSGFKAYSLAGTSISFDYPTAWGVPIPTTDPGFSKRGGTNASDGTYAHLVNFTTNKDVQLAFTSSKYLPVARTALYYDSLQWCLGSSDGKFYQSVLGFATSSGVDTPTTVTCDQGPLSGVSKLDAQTIVQLAAKAPDGSALGDLYTKNLTDVDLPVAHVKDATMSNANFIKTLLGSIKVASSSSSGNVQQ